MTLAIKSLDLFERIYDYPYINRHLYFCEKGTYNPNPSREKNASTA